MAETTDKKRLQQVQQQDLTESRLNDDFLFWLKTKGTNYLLILLIAGCAWMGWNWWHEKKEANRDVAWAELSQATLPQAFDEIAKNHGHIDSIAMYAWLRAGDAHLRELQTGVIGGGAAMPGPDGTTTPSEPLTEEGRRIAQESAAAYYQQVLSAVGNTDLAVAMVPFRLSALFGLAAIDESRGDLDNAKRHLEDVKAAAEVPFPLFAQQAQSRLDSLAFLSAAADIPPRGELPVRPDATTTPNTGAIDGDALIKSLQDPSGLPGQGATQGTNAPVVPTPPANPPAAVPPGTPVSPLTEPGGPLSNSKGPATTPPGTQPSAPPATTPPASPPATPPAPAPAPVKPQGG